MPRAPFETLFSMTLLLERAGAQCTVVENGKAAVEAALHASPPFDCILMDCNMPILDGWGATWAGAYIRPPSSST